MHAFDATLILELAALGMASGFLAGLMGIGGGILLVPCLALVLGGRHVDAGVAVKVAIATSMAIILFTSASSAWAHHRRGAVRWPAVARLAPGILAGGLLSSLAAFTFVKGQVLALFFAVFAIASALHMFADRKVASERGLPGAAGQVGAGTVIGFTSGLVGAGGGFVSDPWMTWCNVPMREAVATSAALGVPIAVASVAGYIVAGTGAVGVPAGSLGYVWLPALVVVAGCSILTAPLGARAAHVLPVARLKKLFGTLLALLAISMVVKAFAG